MRVRLVDYQEVGWILGKFARRLAEQLPALGVQADVANKPYPQADINHHITYAGYSGRANSVDVLMITHIDTASKVELLRGGLATAAMGVCMSRDMQEQLIAHGLPRERLCFIHPAHDGVIRPRKLRIGITSNVYDSGCKREHLVADLASRLDPNDFAFIIMGTGWASVIARLRACSIEVEDLGPFHYQTYQELIPALDYYLYTGQDEGSMGFIDALAAGVRTIVTPQGFHLDVPGGITHAFNELGELARIFDGIAAERRGRVEAVASWTWAEYARKHVRLWQYLLLKRDGQTIPEALKQELILMGIGAGAGGPSSPRTPAAESAPATKAARPIVVIDDLPKSWVTRLARFLERKYFIGREKLRHATGKRLERPATPRRPEE